MSKKNTNISNIVSDLPQYVLIKQKISSKGIDFEKIIKKIKLEFKEQKIDTQDGIRIDYNDKWLLFRNSNTEPIIRIFAESKSKECSIELIEKIKKICNE